MHLNMDTEWMRSTCSIQVHRTLLLNNSICFSQLADSNTKEIKSKTKEWNDRIKQDKVSKTLCQSTTLFFFSLLLTRIMC